MTALHRIDLELGPKVGSGAQGQLYRVDAVRSSIAGSLPSPLIYKEFLAGTNVSGAALQSLADFRTGLGVREQDVVDTMTVWPCAVVEDGSARACGYLMRRIPEAFFQPIETTAGSERIPREIQELFVAEALARKNFGETANGTERMALAREMAYIIGFLHKRDIVYGDLSYKNAVFTLRPHPALILLDCDGVRRIGQAAGVAQLHSPGWKPPEGGPQTKATDRYKLGLFVLRCVTPGVNAQNRDPAKAHGHLDTEGLSLLRRALGDDVDRRTTGKEWVTYFNARIAASGGVRVRTGRAAAPKRPTARRAPPRPWGDAVGARVVGGPPSPGAAAARTYVLAGSTVVAVPSHRAGPATTLPGMPSTPAATSPARAGWPTWTLGKSSYTSPHPPIVSKSVGLILRLAILLPAAFVAILLAVTTNSSSSSSRFSSGPASSTTIERGLAAGASVTSQALTGPVETPIGSSALVAMSGATHTINAINQRVVGLTLPSGTYPTGNVGAGPLPWVVQFAAADPDPASNPSTWTIRNVQATGGSYVELAPSTVVSVALPELDQAKLLGLDEAIKTMQPIVADLTSIAWLCNPSNSQPACDWRIEASGKTLWFNDLGQLVELPSWAPVGSG